MMKTKRSKITERMNKEGKIKTLTFHQSAAIDHKIAMQFEKLKSDFIRKESNSRMSVFNQAIN